MSIYEIEPSRVIHETDVYAVDVGPFPGEKLDCYRIWNKVYGVLEYAHSMHFFAVNWANEATRTFKQNEDGTPLEDNDESLPDAL